MPYPPPYSHSYVPSDMYCKKCGWLLSASNGELHSVNNKKDCPGDELEERVQRTIMGILLIIVVIVVVGGIFHGLVALWENFGLNITLLALAGFYALCYAGHKLGKYLDL